MPVSISRQLWPSCHHREPGLSQCGSSPAGAAAGIGAQLSLGQHGPPNRFLHASQCTGPSSQCSTELSSSSRASRELFPVALRQEPRPLPRTFAEAKDTGRPQGRARDALTDVELSPPPQLSTFLPGHCLPAFRLFPELIPDLLGAAFISFSSLSTLPHLNVPILRLVVPAWDRGLNHSAWHLHQKEATDTGREAAAFLSCRLPCPDHQGELPTHTSSEGNGNPQREGEGILRPSEAGRGHGAKGKELSSRSRKNRLFKQERDQSLCPGT
ncbi:uncharacterized protein LOC123952887 [Meles meles]|uniref:uncharacterized protein LOC123952887 n=1 Tax=Meles meles TaxID=9662 RepID=UPI001E698A3D|nr:uncharacterized protein LOC123952887 [Meles meles]